MTEAIDPRRSDVGALRPIGASETRTTQAPETQGVAFRALLEKLEEHAHELAASTGDVSAPEHLAGAVDRAKETLAEALGVGDRILEAYRQALHQSGGAEEPR